jgi:ribulose-5-phosphate 4-epimerase/fuculose-1-phosphate aldolase
LLLKNHGFISLGRTMEEAGELALLMLHKVSSNTSETGKD